MPGLETREWGLKIFCGMPTLTTHADPPPSTIPQQHKIKIQLTKTDNLQRQTAVGLIIHIRTMWSDLVVM